MSLVVLLNSQRGHDRATHFGATTFQIVCEGMKNPVESHQNIPDLRQMYNDRKNMEMIRLFIQIPNVTHDENRD
jgi:hypothetical protein